MWAYEMEKKLIEEMGKEELILSIYKYFGEWDMRDCYESIANAYDIELEEKEDE